MEKKIFILWLNTVLLIGVYAQPSAIRLPAHQKTADPYIIRPSSSLATTATLYITDLKAKRKMEKGSASFSKSQMKRDKAYIFVDPKHQYDRMIGFGGTITDAAAETFARLPKDKQAEMVKAYFDTKEGIGYTVVRTNMNSCDFSSDSYTYVADNDSSLNSFDIGHDRKFKLPLLKLAKNKAGNDFLLYISPWSPPAWMKTNNNMLEGGELKKGYYQAWANYFIKYIQNLEKEGVPVWGLTIQNEPQSVQTWESCIFDAHVAHDFIKNYMGPTLRKNKMSDKKIIAWDHNRDFSYHYVADMLNDPLTTRYIWGTGIHWYEGGKYENVEQVKKSFPNKNLAFTEGCVEGYRLDRIDDIAIGERYATNIINDLNGGVILWTDWNILLDEKGGPNHVGNFCFAPIHGFIEKGELVYTPAYDYIGHFSKFIRPGARRITASSNRFQLQTTSFMNKDGKVVVVVLNATDDTVPYALFIAGKEANAQSLPHTISTWVI